MEDTRGKLDEVNHARLESIRHCSYDRRLSEAFFSLDNSDPTAPLRHFRSGKLVIYLLDTHPCEEIKSTMDGIRCKPTGMSVTLLMLSADVDWRRCRVPSPLFDGFSVLA